MPTRILLLLLIVFNIRFAGAQPAGELLQKANALYDEHKKEEAKVFYERAASLNNSEAHFYLAYRYVISEEKRLHHYEKAALQGHAQAMQMFLEQIFFRQSDLIKSDPFRALEVYKKGKEANPTMQLFDEAATVTTIRYAVEAGPFDGGAFLKKYNIDTGKMHHAYSVWEIAEEASRKKGRFIDVDGKLLLQLISRGGAVPAEVKIAIDTAYSAWKNQQKFEFNICNYVTSGYGLGYCAKRGADATEVQINRRLVQLTGTLKNKSGRYLKPAYKAAAQFLEAKVWNEELHGGTGYAAWATASLIKQKKELMQLIENLDKGNLPEGLTGLKKNDARLNLVYNDVLVKLQKKAIQDFNADVSADGVRKTQRLWTHTAMRLLRCYIT